MSLMSIMLILISVSLSATSQVLLKFGMVAPHMNEAMKSGDVARIAIAIATSPMVIGGLGLFGLSAVFWLFVLSRTPLSSAYPFVALGIIVTMASGSLLFAEDVSPMKLSGAALIVSGIILVARAA